MTFLGNGSTSLFQIMSSVS